MDVYVYEFFDEDDRIIIEKTPMGTLVGKVKTIVLTRFRPIFWACLDDTMNIDRFERTGRP